MIDMLSGNPQTLDLIPPNPTEGFFVIHAECHYYMIL